MESIITHMKTTLDIDEKKLCRVMKLTGLRTRKETIDFALTEAERLARIRKLLDGAFYVDAAGDVIDPCYDVMKLRKTEKPGHDPC
jgi:Arc/MetJ family transcription regulator